MGQVLALIGGLGSLVCWIMTLMKMWKLEPEDKRVLQLVIGIICGIWAFIWGWMNLQKMPEHKNIMFAWAGAIALSIVGNVLSLNK